MAKPTLVIFVGGMGGSGAEELVSRCHQAIALDMLDRAKDSAAFESMALVTDIETLATEAGTGVALERTSPPFHFGRKLQEVIRENRIDRPFYLSRGSLPLLGVQRLAEIAADATRLSNAAITNNLYSADLVAFAPGDVIDRINLPLTDNPLPRFLRDEAGLDIVTLERSAATLFDVDTPADIMLLALQQNVGKHTRRFLEETPLDLSRLRQAMRVLSDVNAELIVAGRVGSQVWQRLEQGTACRVRMLAEERGMQADGREDRGEARSILGFYLQEVGFKRFFDTLSKLGQAAFVDSRVIFAHLGRNPSRADRFRADMGDWKHIDDPVVKDFTRYACEAPIPVVLGGHSLMAGGMLAAIETCKASSSPS